MNSIFRDRMTHTLVWIGITISFWLVHSNYMNGDLAWALLIAAGITAAVNAVMLLIFRGEPLRMSERLTVLGGLLASMYGRDE